MDDDRPGQMTTRTQPESPAAHEPAEPPEAARPTVSFQADDAMVRGLLEAAPDAIVIVRPDGHIVLVNAQTERMFGYRRDELLGQRVEILLPERFRAAHVGQRAGYHAAPHTRPMGERRDLRAQRKGGSEFPAEISLSPLPTRAGTLVISVIRDITDRMNAEAERARLIREQAAQAEAAEHRSAFLAEAGAQLAASLDYEATLATLARLVVDGFADYCVVYLAEAGPSLRRVAVAHVDRAKTELVHELTRQPPPDPNGPDPLATALRTGRPQLMSEVTDALLEAVAHTPEHLRILRQLGPRSALSVPLVARGRTIGAFSFVAAESGRCYGPADLALAEELARRAALAVDNARLYQEAQEATRVAQEAVRARDVFLARAPHELRTPLTAALGTIGLLRRAAAGGVREPPDTLIEIASRNLGAMAALIDDLLDLSKLVSGRETLALAPVAVATIMRESLDVVGAQARDKGVTVRAAVPAGLTVAADRLKLGQVLVNLLANAVKFTPGGGEVTVEGVAEAESVLIRVRDTGKGIVPEHLEAIFEPFFQAGPTQQSGDRRAHPRGIGLGLAICRQIVTLHSGRIWAESEGPGRGSTFVVRLPAAVSVKGQVA